MSFLQLWTLLLSLSCSDILAAREARVPRISLEEKIPSNVRFAPCLPFSDLRPATKGAYLLGTPRPTCSYEQMGLSSREPRWMGEDQVMKKAVGRGGAGMVPRPKGEGERSLEASKFSSLGKTQRAFE